MNTKKITRYQNRKLYSHSDVSYLNLQEIGDTVRDGHQIEATDNKTKADITNNVLLSIVEQNEAAAMSRRPEPFRPITQELMSRIIVSGGLTQYAQQLEQRMPS